jgi:hypothetical protein
MHPRRDTVHVAILGVILVALAVPALAQSTYGIVVGVVADESKALMPGAMVTATNTATGLSRTVETGSQGAYRIINLLPGTYDITVEMSGFKKATSTGIVVRVNESVRVDFAMQVGQLAETVEVSATAPLLETSSATVGKVITNEKIVQLPLNGRDFTQLTVLMPGASPVGMSGGGFIIGGTSVSVTGNRADQNNFTLDGVNNNETFFKHYGIRPSIDAIQEFKVVTNGYAAEYGRSSSGVVSVALKSGTNQLHGSLYEFFRHDDSLALTIQPSRCGQLGVFRGGADARPEGVIYGAEDAQEDAIRVLGRGLECTARGGGGAPQAKARPGNEARGHLKRRLGTVTQYAPRSGASSPQSMIRSPGDPLRKRKPLARGVCT